MNGFIFSHQERKRLFFKLGEFHLNKWRIKSEERTIQQEAGEEEFATFALIKKQVDFCDEMMRQPYVLLNYGGIYHKIFEIVKARQPRIRLLIYQGIFRIMELIENEKKRVIDRLQKQLINMMSSNKLNGKGSIVTKKGFLFSYIKILLV